MIKVEINEGDVLSLKVALKGLEPKRVFGGELLPFAEDIGDYVGEYPPDFPGNTYIRTGHLGRSWAFRENNPLEAEIRNAAIYAGWVHGHEQLALHAGHDWRHLYNEATRMAVEFMRKIAAKVDRIWRK